LRIREILELPAELVGEQLGDAVLEAFTLEVRERQVVGILAHAQHAFFGEYALRQRYEQKRYQSEPDPLLHG
jgi:hypothetical protein